MCLICIELLGSRMTTYDARIALVELKGGLPPGHAEDVKRLIEALDWKNIRPKQPTDFPEDYD